MSLPQTIGIALVSAALLAPHTAKANTYLVSHDLLDRDEAQFGLIRHESSDFKGLPPVKFGFLNTDRAVGLKVPKLDDAIGIGLVGAVGLDSLLFSTSPTKAAWSNKNVWNIGSPTIGLSTTPLPAALPLFASGLGIILLVFWRRRKNGFV